MNAVLDHPIQHDGLGRLRDKHLFRELGYIDGRWFAGQKAETFPVLDPATGQRLARVASLGEAETTLAIDAAVKAFSAGVISCPGTIRGLAALVRAGHGKSRRSRIADDAGAGQAAGGIARRNRLWRIFHRMVCRRGQAS